MYVRRLLWLFLIYLLPLSLYAATPLPQAQAFKLSLHVYNNENLTLQASIAKGYYLYAKRLSIRIDSSPSSIIGHIFWPATHQHHVPGQGVFDVYDQSFTTNIPILHAKRHIRLILHYQGCAQAGFCYPPTVTHWQCDLTQTHPCQPNDIPTPERNAAPLHQPTQFQQVLAGHHLSIA